MDGLLLLKYLKDIGKNKFSLFQILKNKREYKEDNCLNCYKQFVYRYKGIPICFCESCKKSYKKKKCSLCPNEYIDDINSLDILCNDCDEKSKECLDCDNKFISENENEIRCHMCQYRFTNKLTIIFCQECDKEVEINKNDKNFKKHCKDCYKKKLTYIDCISCKIPFKRLPIETWRKSCSDCYHKSCNSNV